jgi:hypothetical protein
MEPNENPQSACPQCRAWTDDLDGFGTVFCTACGFCAHVSQSGKDGYWVCNACGKQLRPLGVPRPGAVPAPTAKESK